MPPRTSKAETLPEHPKWVTIEHSDGNRDQWPKNTEQYVDNFGDVNFYKPLEVDHGFAIKWRRTIGQRLAEMLGLPDKGMSVVVPMQSADRVR